MATDLENFSESMKEIHKRPELSQEEPKLPSGEIRIAKAEKLAKVLT